MGQVRLGAVGAVVLAAALAGMIGGAAAQTPPTVKLTETIDCESEYEAYDASKSTAFKDRAAWEQARCLPRLKGAASRDGDVLRLVLASGAVKSFKDLSSGCGVPSDPEKCTQHILAAFYPQNQAFLVLRQSDVGNARFLIERASGRVLSIPGPVHFSPDGRSFVSGSFCFEDCPDRLDVWSVQEGTAKLEWRFRTGHRRGHYDFTFRGWDGNDRVRYEISKLDDDREAPKEVTLSSTLVRDGSNWRFDPPVP
jgi:hypothetical protein